MTIPMDPEESRYHHLLSTNDSEPPDVELEEVWKIIAQRELNLLELETRIAVLQEMLESLSERRTHEEKMLSRFRAVAAPVRRLPQDVLTEIFLFTRDWREYDADDIFRELTSTPVRPLPIPSPLVITHVCCQWRCVALRTPALWATIRAVHTQFLSGSGPDHDERLQTWLARTGTHFPFDITFKGPGLFGITSKVPLSWIEPYMHRIRTLNVEGSLWNPPSTRFDVLETLSLSSYSLEDKVVERQTSFPSLHQVILRGEEINLPPFIPWRQLTHLFLEVEWMEPSILCVILSEARALVKFHAGIRNIESEVDSAITYEPCILPHIETIIVDGDVEWFFAHLTLPALTTLRIKCYSWHMDLYNSFRSRSMFSLKCLKLDITYMGGSEVVDVIRAALTVKEFIAELLETNMLISALASPDLASHLEYLEAYRYKYDKFGDNVVLDMMALRDSSGASGVLLPDTPSGLRVFRSQVPKRLWDGQGREFSILSGNGCDMIFF